MCNTILKGLGGYLCDALLTCILMCMWLSKDVLGAFWVSLITLHA